MRRVVCAFAYAVLAAEPAAPAKAADDPLARARLLYNQRRFESAVSAAEQARLMPSRADAADLVAARAYLERFRESAASDDLTNARERLRRLDPWRLAPRERIEYIVGLGETLYFDGAYGAAAAEFGSVLVGGDLLTGDSRERVLDWWADALDREARLRVAAQRSERQRLAPSEQSRGAASGGGAPRAFEEAVPAEPNRGIAAPGVNMQPAVGVLAVYQRIRARMDDELANHPGNGTAAYWLAAAARAQGDVQAAWDAAEAAWVRAPLASDRGAKLRADLDRLMLRALIPERAKLVAQPPQALQAEWERFKERWKP